MKRYIRASSDSDIFNQLMMDAATSSEFSKFFENIANKSSDMYNSYFVTLCNLLDDNATDAEINDLMEDAAYELPETNEYRNLYYYLSYRIRKARYPDDYK